MKVLAVASECFPLVKTGGLADVVGALPGALAPHGVEVRTMLPGYRAVLDAAPGAPVLHTMPLMGGEARLREATVAGLPLVILDAPHLFERDGGPYSDPEGRDWADNPQRFAALGQAAAAAARGALGGWRPNVLHAHDWQAGYAIAFLHYNHEADEGPAPRTVFTVHNMAFQGWAHARLLGELGLPFKAFDIDGVEFFGGISPLKAGLRLADRITTVSPGYAAEITRREHGEGLDGLLRSRRAELSGIVNGIDTTVWDPAKDLLLPGRYTSAHGRRRGRNKAALQEAMGLEPEPGALLYGVISRLSAQKGIDLILEALPALLESGAQLAVLGTGEKALEAGLQKAAAANPGRVGVRIGYDEVLAHTVQAGADAVLVPSRFEPCGLVQLCAQRYGAVPVVSRVGGLADTVVDANGAALRAGVATGVQFVPPDADGLRGALARTAALWRDADAWGKVQRNAMKADVSWGASGAAYAALFRDLLAA